MFHVHGGSCFTTNNSYLLLLSFDFSNKPKPPVLVTFHYLSQYLLKFSTIAQNTSIPFHKVNYSLK